MRRLVALWFASLVVVAILASALTVGAQSGVPRERPSSVPPRVVSGNDVGFRVEGIDITGKPYGRLVIRVEGNWIETTEEIGLRPLK
jgi:hypothetical protein